MALIYPPHLSVRCDPLCLFAETSIIFSCDGVEAVS